MKTQQPNKRMMNAVVLHDFGGPDVLKVCQVARPQPGPGEVLTRVYAASVNPVDLQTRRGDYRDWVSLPAILGVDASGIVEEVGVGVTEFAPGDEVFYSPQLFGGNGSYSEYHIAPASIVARKPRNLSHAEAACLPLAAGTAWDCLATRTCLHAGESVLVHAGAGGVGSFAIQLARLMGARVLTTCSERSREFVKSLGPDVVIDYKRESVAARVLEETNGVGVDVVLDTVGGEAIEEAARVLRPHGRLATIVDVPRGQKLLEFWAKNLTIHFVFTEQERTKLNVLRDLVERGQLRPHLDATYPLIQADQAHKRLEAGGVRGKIVLVNGE